ncbi:oxidoreductase [Pseudonocardia humida]|uniref:Oxidoreductase n=1 Tax=Pseudonocardia humida TaxID=2800819 RepID=A0ABT0ZU00_9PSEU|nr:oxidoreductase [Pseudonocardia humida]MCO1654193.1 oxidoreductase [Pseudonocardia humida]
MSTARTRDPLAPLLDLPGVADAVTRARDAVVEVHNHPVNRRGWPASAAEASVRAARASAALDGAALGSGDAVADPLLAGALRAAEETGRLLGAWRTAPLQAVARLHVVAAADLVPPDRHADELGRPRPDRAVGARMGLLADLVAGGTSVPAPVLVAVVHGELLALAPFATADGVVARAAARLAAVAAGLDPKGLAVPEVGHLRHAAQYREAAAGFAAGTEDGVAAWLRHCCAQWEAGAAEGLSIANARQ